jgi:eukaryotic-like serine/threonine-protein kinase
MLLSKLVSFAGKHGLKGKSLDELMSLVTELVDDSRDHPVLSLSSDLAPVLSSHSLSIQGTTTVEPHVVAAALAHPTVVAIPSKNPAAVCDGVEGEVDAESQRSNHGATTDSGASDPASNKRRETRRITSTSPAPPLPMRYRDLGLLGLGGMGEVRRVLDRDLNRTVAMKVIAAHLMEQPSSLARFVEEAQVSAQLEHPAIIPVHELGRLLDGRLYFTMQEIRGRTMAKMIREVHRGGHSVGVSAGSGALGAWTFRRLVMAFLRVCEAVAYAHGRGVVHRDLKPSNIMLGRNGEVTVVDWGIAKVLGRPRSGDLDDEQMPLSLRGKPRDLTLRGAVTGTPAYMPPEQAMGQTDRIDTRSDVYALGAILYEVLCGAPPYQGLAGKMLLFEVIQRPPKPVTKLAARPLPEALVEVCERAMAREPALRYQDARALAKEINDWLEGVSRRERAMTHVEASQQADARAAALRADAASLRARARALMKDVSLDDEDTLKAPGWACEDEARALEREAASLRHEAEQRLQSALSHDPELVEAHAALATRYAEDHSAAESQNDSDAASRAEVHLRAHLDALPEQHPARRRHAAYLQGVGSLSLWTDPPGAEVKLYRFVTERRRLVTAFDSALSKTPIQDMVLSTGAYLLTLNAPGRVEVRYPVLIERLGHWDGRPAEGAAPYPVLLPLREWLAPDDVYVAAGWFYAGGDKAAPGAIPRQRLWRDGFIIKRFPITNAEYLIFLNDLMAAGQEVEALRHAPRELAGTAGEEGALIYGQDANGKFYLRPDGSGDPWLADEPARMIDWFGAVAYSRWRADRDALPWRLPSEWEWEKAARGVDGRSYPWGDFLDPSWCCMRDNHGERPMLTDTYPVDDSPYGVRGMAGNVADWCADLYRRNPLDSLSSLDDVSPGWVARGGDWGHDDSCCRVSHRAHHQPFHRSHQLSFRLARSLPDHFKQR